MDLVTNCNSFLNSSKGCTSVSDRQLAELFRMRYQVVLAFSLFDEEQNVQ